MAIIQCVRSDIFMCIALKKEGLSADNSICRVTHSQLPDSFTSAWQRWTSPVWQPQSLHPGCPAKTPATSSSSHSYCFTLKIYLYRRVFSILDCIFLCVHVCEIDAVSSKGLLEVKTPQADSRHQSFQTIQKVSH